MSTFDIKKFLIKEGMTRVSRDRKRLLKEGYGENLNQRLLDIIHKNDELGFETEVRPGHQWEDVIGDWDPEEVEINAEMGSDDPMSVEPGKYVMTSGDFVRDLEDELGEEIPWTYYIWYTGPNSSYETYFYKLDGPSQRED